MMISYSLTSSVTDDQKKLNYIKSYRTVSVRCQSRRVNVTDCPVRMPVLLQVTPPVHGVLMFTMNKSSHIKNHLKPL